MIPHQDHIWDLCHEHEITVRWSRARSYSQRSDGTWRGTARGVREIIISWQATGEDAYWVALHEIAHLVLDNMGLPQDERGTKAEAECWEWALAVARITPSLSQVSRISTRLAGYAADWGDHPHRERVVDAYRAAWQGAPKARQGESSATV